MRSLILFMSFILIFPASVFSSLPPETGQRLADIAAGYKNVRESKGENRSPEIDSFLKDLGLPTGLPWCLAFVQRCWKDHSVKYNARNPMPKGVARVSSLLSIASQNPFVWKIKTAKSLMLGASVAKVGDMTIHISGKGISPKSNFNGHIGIIGIVGNLDSNYSWEGNTGPERGGKILNVEEERNAGGSTAGVYLRHRTYSPNSSFRIYCLIEPVTSS